VAEHPGAAPVDFDRGASPAWLAAATIALGHAAAEQVAAGEMGVEQAGLALRASVRRVFGVPSCGA
jgi:hypothetical protein